MVSEEEGKRWNWGTHRSLTYFFLSFFFFFLDGFFDMQIPDMVLCLKWMMMMMMSPCGWQNAWLITLVSVLVLCPNMLKDFKLLTPCHRCCLQLPCLLFVLWVDCALVINLVYWKASVREMMCVNCMNSLTPPGSECVAVRVLGFALWIWVLSTVECWAELNWVDSDYANEWRTALIRVACPKPSYNIRET